MRNLRFILLVGAAVFARPALAADTLKFGPPPPWVVTQIIPDKPSQASDSPVAVLLNDSQIRLDPGRFAAFTELAMQIQTAEGLAAGNISLPWEPSTDTITVNKLHIIRGGKVIDVLAGGQSFTTLRRETNLDAATLDGTLTANIQPEGLQVGDIIDIATTQEHVDPVLKNHVEGTFGDWNGVPIEFGHVRVSWPTSMGVSFRLSDDLPNSEPLVKDGREVLELSQRAIQPLLQVKNAPARFELGRFGELTDYHSWADVADVMMPLYKGAAVIAPAGPLRDEVEAIRKQAHSPKERAEKALELVQNRVRYVALEMGAGGLVPAPAEATWSRRFGDCKGKSALLLALLHELGVEAEPVLVHTSLGDILPQRLPLVAYFNHVIVRAAIGGKTYWLDGTRLGDTDLDRIPVPDFEWGLPIGGHSSLVSIIPPPRSVPNSDSSVTIDATAGIFASAPTRTESVIRGDGALAMKFLIAKLTPAQEQEQLRQFWKRQYDFFEPTTMTADFDEPTGELHLKASGVSKIDWSDGWFHVPDSSLGYNPDLDRAAGRFHDAPFATNYPNFEHHMATIRLPAGFLRAQKAPPEPVQETLLGVQYRRLTTVAGDSMTVETSERTIVPEVPYKAALADKPKLKTISDADISLRLPRGYIGSDKDLNALLADSPTTERIYLVRGLELLERNRFDEAIADFTQAGKLEPKSAYPPANRAFAYIYKGDLKAADEDLATAENLDPDNPVALRARGLLAQRKGDSAAAISWYSKSLIQDPGNGFAQFNRARAYYALDKYDLALADTEGALKAGDTSPDVRVLRANIFRNTGKPSAVAAEAEAMMRDNPSSNYAFVAAGKTYAALGQTDKALKAFDRAIALKPAAFVYINRAEVRPSSDTAARLSDLDQALKLDPQNADALAEKAQVLVKTGDYAAALRTLDSVKASSKDSYLERLRATVLYKAGRTAEAQKALQEQRQAAKSASDFNSLCWTEATAGIMLESALQNCEDALKLKPDTGAYEDSLGMVLLKLGKLDEALHAYNEAIAHNMGADSLMGRAFVYLRMGDRSRAEADSAAARKAAPDIEDVFAGYGLTFEQPRGSSKGAAH